MPKSSGANGRTPHELARRGIVFGHGRQVAVLAEDVDFSPADREHDRPATAGHPT